MGWSRILGLTFQGIHAVLCSIMVADCSNRVTDGLVANCRPEPDRHASPVAHVRASRVLVIATFTYTRRLRSRTPTDLEDFPDHRCFGYLPEKIPGYDTDQYECITRLLSTLVFGLSLNQ
ncbi:hypothetical protein J6590_030207 [Homalodisca vitripennis]|nr:hypothetical protein J6590_030207 [Homalodisca vitripennis]